MMLQYTRSTAMAAVAVLASAILAMATGRDLLQFTNQYAAGGLDFNGDQGVYGGGKVNVCSFPKGSLQNPDPFRMKTFLDVLPVTATVILSESDPGSFIAPPRGFYHYGPGCNLYNYVCDFSTSDPCNLRGVCQSNNTCFCGNGFKTCFTNSGTTNDATTGCETDIFNDPLNCGGCFLGCPAGFPFCVGGVCSTTANTTGRH